MGAVLLCWFMSMVSVALCFALPCRHWMIFIYIITAIVVLLSILVTIVSMEELANEKK